MRLDAARDNNRDSDHNHGHNNEQNCGHARTDACNREQYHGYHE
jgi:hypothetical protein